MGRALLDVQLGQAVSADYWRELNPQLSVARLASDLLESCNLTPERRSLIGALCGLRS